MQTSGEDIDPVKRPEYIITRLSKDNLADVTFLHKEVYGRAVAPDHFSKKYDTAYTGAEYVGFLAYNNEQVPVAYYGVIPCFIQYEDKIVLAAQSADTMTHPKYRYKGMFLELANITYRLCSELGIHLVIGFPNQNSLHGGNKLGFTMPETMSCFTIRIKSLPFGSLSKKNRFFGKIYQQYSRFILRKYKTSLKGITSSVVQDGFGAIHRNNAYLNYKTYSTTKVIRIGNANIWISIKQVLQIGDMEGISDTNFNGVIDRLKRIAKKLGLRQIQFHCSTGTSLHRLFTVISDTSPSFPVLFRDSGSAVPVEKIKFTFADIDIF